MTGLKKRTKKKQCPKKNFEIASESLDMYCSRILGKNPMKFGSLEAKYK